MLPLAAWVSIRHQQGPRFRIWLPLFLLWLVLLPVALLLAPLIGIACLVFGLDPFEAFLLIWRVLVALRGTDVEVETYWDAVTVRIV
jgi:uncharacterized membrane protein